jgi:predicted TIM-barrel fold metal-dependent hydrolase
VLARHPKTTFIGLHVGHSSEDLGAAAQALDRFPNFHVEIAARIGELGRQPRRSRWFFDKYQDRILFGTDGVEDELYPHYFRFLETDDEYFDYGPGPVPGQGRWRIYGIGLPDAVLRKVYSENAVRLLAFRQAGLD